MSRLPEHAPDEDCEYGRCGGLGRHEVKRKRRARETMRIGNRLWHVCESCADLLLRDAAAEAYAPARVRSHADGEQERPRGGIDT